jgi:hypothetical protein
MNILANCRKHYPKDVKDLTKVTPVNPQGYIPDPQWTNFLKDWASVLDSATELEYSSCLVQFRKHKGEALKYVEDTWLTPWKEKLVRFWVD